MSKGEFETMMDMVSDRLGAIYQKVGDLEPRLGGDGRKCTEIMDELVELMQQVEDASGRKLRIN